MAGQRFNRRSLFGGIVFLFALVGCLQKVDTATNAPLPEMASVNADIVLSPNQRIGFVSWINPEDNTFVIEIDPYLDIVTGALLIARIENDAPQAVVQIAGKGHSRYRPAQVLAGSIAIGLEVVAPGPELRSWGAALITSSQ